MDAAWLADKGIAGRVPSDNIRQLKALLLADALNEWLTFQRQRVPDGSATAKAIDDSLNRWAAPTRCLDDGDLPANNN